MWVATLPTHASHAAMCQSHAPYICQTPCFIRIKATERAAYSLVSQFLKSKAIIQFQGDEDKRRPCAHGQKTAWRRGREHQCNYRRRHRCCQVTGGCC